MKNTDPIKLRQLLEERILDKIEECLANKTLTLERVQEISTIILDNLPENISSIEELEAATEIIKTKVPELNI